MLFPQEQQSTVFSDRTTANPQQQDEGTVAVNCLKVEPQSLTVRGPDWQQSEEDILSATFATNPLHVAVRSVQAELIRSLDSVNINFFRLRRG